VEAVFRKTGALTGEISVPGDKSISHRAAIVGALARGTTNISGFSTGADCASTLEVLRVLGAPITDDGDTVTIEGTGGRGFEQPSVRLECGNSGTTMRLMAGAVAPYPIEAVLTGDESLLARPMGRIIEPLTLMGACLEAGDDRGHPPLRIRGGGLRGINYSVPVASAQVKSAILLAGLGAKEFTTVNEPAVTRDHTERMLRASGIDVRGDGLSVTVAPGVPGALDFAVPGDFSSAAFFIAAALMCPGSRVVVKSVGLNPTRTAFLQLARRMGAMIEEMPVGDGWEPVGDIKVEYGSLRAIEVLPTDVAGAIDEVTLVALLATAASGTTVISGAGELRHKEFDRIKGAVDGLRAMGAHIEETGDGMVIEGPSYLVGTRVSSSGDHRLGMMLAVAGLAASGETTVDGWEWTRISYPGFAHDLETLKRGE